MKRISTTAPWSFRAVVLSAALLSLQSCSESPSCVDDRDCRGGTTCHVATGLCVVPDADAGAVDAGAVDAGVVDAGEVDAGVVDAGEVDAGVVDAGEVDAGVVDAGVPDAGVVDAGVPDAGFGWDNTDWDVKNWE